MRKNGFSLVEILIVTVIFTGIMIVVASFGLDIFDFGMFLEENLNTERELQLTLREIFLELRSMKPAVSGAYPISSADGDTITFFSDIDNDGNAEKIRYFVENETFKKSVIAPSGDPLDYDPDDEKIKDMVHYIYSPDGDIFSYFDFAYTGDQQALAVPVNVALIRMIRVSITSDKTPDNEIARINHFISVNLRNI